MNESTNYIMGVDLGKKNDYTALCVIQKTTSLNEDDSTYEVCYLRRYTLGTSYPDIVRSVCELLKKHPLNTGCEIVVDATGVGTPVVDMMREERLSVKAVWISGGNKVTEKGDDFTVPKRELIGTLQILLEQGKLKIASKLKDAHILIKELKNFKVKINTKTAHDSYEAWRESDHDDLVLSVAIACWYATKKPAGQFVMY